MLFRSSLPLLGLLVVISVLRCGVCQNLNFNGWINPPPAKVDKPWVNVGPSVPRPFEIPKNPNLPPTFDLGGSMRTDHGNVHGSLHGIDGHLPHLVSVKFSSPSEDASIGMTAALDGKYKQAEIRLPVTESTGIRVSQDNVGSKGIGIEHNLVNTPNLKVDVSAQGSKDSSGSKTVMGGVDVKLG